MKKILTLFSFLFVSTFVFAGTPTLDGSFDGTSVWGDPVATGDNIAGWASANAKNIYFTQDATYYYFGAEVAGCSSWMDWGFALNTKLSSGGSTEPWGRKITFATPLPDFIIKGHFNSHAELRSWNGSAWASTTLTNGTDFGENETAFVEARIAKNTLPYINSLQVLFYITGNGSDHGTFDAVPDATNVTSWTPANPTTLSSYTSNMSGVTFGKVTLDGSFDGTSIWGAAVATGNGTVGWGGAEAKKLYVTSDANFTYFGAEVACADWHDWGFVINTIADAGGSTEPWGRSITFDHTQKPDYVIKGHFGDPTDNGSNSPIAQLFTWTGSGWSTAQTYTNYMAENETQFIEIAIPRSVLNNASSGGVQFYITGNNNNHGTFDAVPDAANSTSWNQASNKTPLDSYQASILTIELTQFTAVPQANSVLLSWATASETNNSHFEVERSTDARTWAKVGEVKGNGSKNVESNYTFTDAQPTTGINYYRLKQVDTDGKFAYHKVVSVVMGKGSKVTIAPNPAHEQLQILGATEGGEASIFNVSGQLMMMVKNTTTLNISALPSGVYQLRYQSENGETTLSRFVKQ